MSHLPSGEFFDLFAPRTILLTDSKAGKPRLYTLHCRRLTDSDWQAYFAGIVITAEQEGKTRINTFDVASPRVALAEAVLAGAGGYTVHGGGNLTELPNWQAKIPLGHRQRLGEALSDVRAAAPASEEDGGITIYPEGEVVFLDATFSAVEYLDEVGESRLTMKKLLGLKHVFATPTEAQHRRYMREASRSIVVGGSRTGKTIYQGSQPLLAKLYDELIVSVEGYSVDGVTLTTDQAAIVREMDTLHKVMAAQDLFQPQDTSALVDEGSASDSEGEV